MLTENRCWPHGLCHQPSLPRLYSTWINVISAILVVLHDAVDLHSEMNRCYSPIAMDENAKSLVAPELAGYTGAVVYTWASMDKILAGRRPRSASRSRSAMPNAVPLLTYNFQPLSGSRCSLCIDLYCPNDPVQISEGPRTRGSCRTSWPFFLTILVLSNS